MLDQGGIDATPAFEDVGHSDDARGILAKYKLGRAEELVRIIHRILRKTKCILSWRGFPSRAAYTDKY